MFHKERHDQIVHYVQERGRASVSELAERFDVTEDCIRKDLKQLDGQGSLERVYGGAISVSAAPERSVYKRMNVNTAEKAAIAQKAYEQIREGETIFLDISTTNVILAGLLAKGQKRCIVMSNMIDVLNELATNPALTVICTGGNVNLEANGYVGALTVSTLERVRFDRAFLGAVGVDLESGEVTTFDVDDGLVKECVIGNSRKRYLVVDAHKLRSRGNYQFAQLADFDAVITDSPSAATRKALKARGTECL
ncbi:MAG: DeoR/GlpR family DNA-binding transcription regulator [Atopobiaceae bacterium]|jgi:DeoR family glycerol-3-phosphate regulon repressor|nr:DeoR/GlpR family DNA-binding transcription regulator [Atopobiaceae bacterium]